MLGGGARGTRTPWAVCQQCLGEPDLSRATSSCGRTDITRRLVIGLTRRKLMPRSCRCESFITHLPKPLFLIHQYPSLLSARCGAQRRAGVSPRVYPLWAILGDSHRKTGGCSQRPRVRRIRCADDHDVNAELNLRLCCIQLAWRRACGQQAATPVSRPPPAYRPEFSSGVPGCGMDAAAWADGNSRRRPSA
jgi:hypothetical protein